MAMAKYLNDITHNVSFNNQSKICHVSIWTPDSFDSIFQLNETKCSVFWYNIIKEMSVSLSRKYSFIQDVTVLYF